ncbi:hypothetical protein NIES4101_69580 [Calothrix sp. NIES-4101]|nr:hypothetical protein NIES4101_69580 [Calothrix sp. NIES-4101]
MLITVIDNIEQFHQLKTSWEQVYNSDQYAQIFLSWSWLRGYLEYSPQKWLILALQSDYNSPYIGFFPIGIRSLEWKGFGLYKVLCMAGEPLADYTGFICLPEYEEQVISAFASYVQENLEWDYFHIKEISDPRFENFLKYFSQDKFELEITPGSSCSYIPLSTSWEEYLQDILSSKARKNLRYALRQFESQINICLKESQSDNFEIQLNALLTLMQMQRGSQPEHLLNVYREIFLRVAENNNLWLSILWEGEEPIAGTGILVDDQRKRIYGCMTGYNPKYSKLSPGRVIIAYSIQKAIKNNIEIYDFLRGNESYKFSFFGTTEKINTDYVINRKAFRTSVIKIIKQISPVRKLIRSYIKPF